MIKRIAENAGLTEIELKIFLFLISVLIGGLIIKYTQTEPSVIQQKFNYSEQDSQFIAGSKPDSSLYGDAMKTKFDYKQEVLDFNKSGFSGSKVKKTASEKSINLNGAGVKELISIPGLGEKTAQKIIDYRSQSGPFTDLNQLRNIKGIGIRKYQQIVKYLFVD